MFGLRMRHTTSCTTFIVIVLFSSLCCIDCYQSMGFRQVSIRNGLKPLHSAPISETPNSIYQTPAPGSIMTLSRFMIEATRSNPDHADFESLMASIQIACKTIANLVSKAGISDLTGLQSSSNFPHTGALKIKIIFLVSVLSDRTDTAVMIFSRDHVQKDPHYVFQNVPH